PSPRSAAYARARSSMAGGMSMPVACRATAANAHTTSPGPQATSRTVSSGPAPLQSTMSFSAASSLIDGAVANGTAWRGNWSRISSECLLVDTAALHDELEIVLVLQRSQISERVALQHDQVGVLAGFHAADPVRHAEQVGVDPGGRQQDLHGLHHLALQLELDGALAGHVPEQVGARADLAAGLVGVGQALERLLAGQVDLGDLVIADAVALALPVNGFVRHHGRHQERVGGLDGLGGGRPDEGAVLDR